MSEWKSWGRAHREEWWGQFLRTCGTVLGMALASVLGVALVFGGFVCGGILWGMR